MRYTLGFIGCGNMGGALARVAVKSLPAEKIAVCDKHEEKTRPLANDYGVKIENLQTIAKESKFIVLGVKPQGMEQTLVSLSDIVKNRDDVVLVTMAAATEIRKIRDCVGANLPVIRIMPNTPAVLGAGMLLYTIEGVTAQDEEEFLHVFASAGRWDKLPEELMDAGGALSGCGPAFVYAFAQALTEGAVECGVPREKAELYAAQTLKGASEMLLAFGDPESLKKAVCSPGGTTIEGIRVLEETNFQAIVKSAVNASYQKSLKLKK